MNLSDRTTIGPFWATFTNTGTKPPKPVADAHATMAALTARASRLRTDGSDLAPAVAAALTDGRDPASDPEVQRITTALALSANEALIETVGAAATDTFRSVCTEQHEEIVSAWRKPFDAAAEKLAHCFEQIGPVPLEDTTSIMQRGGDIAAVWAEARKAARTIDIIEAGWSALGEFTRTVQTNPNYRVLRLASVDYETWTDKGLHRARLTPWEFLLADLSLSLPTVDEYRARAAVITRGDQEPATVVDRERSYIAGHEIRVPVR